MRKILNVLLAHVCAAVVPSIVTATSIRAQEIGSLRTVQSWEHLARLHGSPKSACLVLELRRRGLAVFCPRADLPAWASGADIPGLSIGDAGGKGKWIHTWQGPVDFGRLGTKQDGNATDERKALALLIGAGFDDIRFPEGRYDGFLNLTVAKPLTVRGAGRGRTVFVGDNVSGHAAFVLKSSLTLSDASFERQARLVTINPDAERNLGRLDFVPVEGRGLCHGLKCQERRSSGWIGSSRRDVAAARDARLQLSREPRDGAHLGSHRLQRVDRAQFVLRGTARHRDDPRQCGRLRGATRERLLEGGADLELPLRRVVVQRQLRQLPPAGCGVRLGDFGLHL